MKRARSIPRRGLLVVAVVVAALPPAAGPAPAQPAQNKRLVVLTLNIHLGGLGDDGKRDLGRIARVITAANPDLVALQEVHRNAKQSGGVDQPKELARLTKMHAEFGKAFDFKDGGEFGVAVLTRAKPADENTHPLPHGKGREPRAALAVRLRPPGKDVPELVFASVHLQSDKPKDEKKNDGEPDRIAQAKEIEKIFNPVKVPVVLAGDLNARPGDKPLKELGDRWNAVPDKDTIDYVLVRKSDNWRVISAKKLTDENSKAVSDHLPLLVELEWRGGK